MKPRDRAFERAARLSAAGLILVALGIGLAPWMDGGAPAILTSLGVGLGALGLHRMGRAGHTQPSGPER